MTAPRSRRPLLPVLALALAAALAAPGADPGPEATRVTAATIYPFGARVTREAALDLPAGLSEAVLGPLPARLDAASLQASGRAAAAVEILDVALRNRFVDTEPDPRRRELEERRQAVADDLRALADRAQTLARLEAFLGKIEIASLERLGRDLAGAAPRPPEPAAYGEILDLLGTRLDELAAERRTLDVRQRDLQRQAQTIQASLARLPEGPREIREAVVRVRAGAATRAVLALTALMPDASWSPVYQARLDTTATPATLALQAGALVRQATGEDWSGVTLALSTARPSLGGRAPEPPPLVVEPAHHGESVRFETVVAAMAPPLPEDRRDGEEVHSMDSPEEKAMTEASATLLQQATSATFVLPEPVDLAADNQPRRFAISTTSLAPALRHEATPRLQPTAFLLARTTNTTGAPLLPGRLEAFLDGTFVAATPLAFVPPGGELDLALGPDESVEVKHELRNRFEETAGLTGRTARTTWDHLFTVRNHRPGPVTLVLSDRLPVSRHEDIEVDLLAPADDAAGFGVDDAGLARWTLELPPGAERTLPFRYRVDHPSSLPVTGLP